MDINQALQNKNKLISKLESWRDSNLVKPNWDSYEANPITNETIEAAIYIAQLITGEVITTVIPTRAGDIEFSDDHETIIVTVVAIPENKPLPPQELTTSPTNTMNRGDIFKTAILMVIAFSATWLILSLLNYIFG